MMKNNNHKKMVFQDNFIKKWCKSAKNHPSGWNWWKRYVRKQTKHRLKQTLYLEKNER